MGRSVYGLWFQGWERRGGVPPTWYLLVWLEIDGTPCRIQRAIGPLSWTSAREMAARWEREFGMGTSRITQTPQRHVGHVGPARRPRSAAPDAGPTPDEPLPGEHAEDTERDSDDVTNPDDPDDPDDARDRGPGQDPGG